MTLLNKFWMEMYGAVDEKRTNPERGKFALMDMQVDAVDETAGLQPVIRFGNQGNGQRAGHQRANEHEWNNQF